MSAAAIRDSHFAAMVLFALLVSVALACLGRQTLTGRVKFALLSFALFLVIGVGVAWLMYAFVR